MNRGTEDYLKIIYKLGGEEKVVSISSIAKKLNISSSSVNEMIKSLLKKEFLNYEPYKGVVLTGKGVYEARKVIKKHRIWEVFLTEILKYDWSEVHEEAERLEHVTSEKLEKALYDFLGEPEKCPHGYPINISAKSKTEDKTLYEYEVGKIIKIDHIEEDDKLLEYLSYKKIKPNLVVKVNKKDRFNGPITIEIDEQEVVIGREAAIKIYAKEI